MTKEIPKSIKKTKTVRNSNSQLGVPMPIVYPKQTANTNAKGIINLLKTLIIMSAQLTITI